MHKKKKKKTSAKKAPMGDMEMRPRLHGGINFPPSYDEKDRKEINEIGYLVKNRKVDREDFLS